MPPVLSCSGPGRHIIRRQAVSVSLPYIITANHASTASPDNVQTKLPPAIGTKNTQRFREFNLQDRIFAVTGGARGLGLAMAEALMEAGANVWCLDRLKVPDAEFQAAKDRAQGPYGGSIKYAQIDVRDEKHVSKLLTDIANERQRLDGMICAAGINHIHTAIGHSQDALDEVMKINYNGVFNCATAAAQQMFRHKTKGSILLVASMSGLVANKGMTSPVYNSSKAAVIQLGRCLAMEWGRHGIRVNNLCPGHILTPMVEQVFEENPAARATWEAENMMGRLARPEEFRGAALFALSDASTFMTGSNLVIDGGHTAW